tara:strand:- start:1250 stop:1468 length:219 start_codon:yes stop_codon:yes gene_type:complete
MGKYKDIDPGFHKPIGKVTAVPMPTVTGNKNDKSKPVPMPTIGNKKKKKKSNEAIIQEFKVRHKSLLQGYKK